MSLCLAAASLLVPLMSDAVTLSWTHSVERTRWEEDWRARDGALALVEARVEGAGAGMEPPPDARLVDGFYVWRPQVPPIGELVLRRSGATEDWRICVAGACRSAGELLPPDADPVVLRACDAQ